MLSMEICRERIYFCYICIWSCSVFFREKNPLLVDLQPEMTPSARANMWFEKVSESEIYVRTGQELEQIRIPSYYKAREKLPVQGAISFVLAGDFKPITERSKRNA